MYKVVLFYKYIKLNAKNESEKQINLGKKLGLSGRILIADEGINGTVASLARTETHNNNNCPLDEYIKLMSEDIRFKDVDWKVSFSNVEPFPDFVVKNQKTIISTGNYIIPPPNPETFPGGKHLKPEEFHNELTKALTTHKDDYVVLDVRNNQEHLIGNFQGSINPKTRFFSEWPTYIEKNLTSIKDKKILMYCTGGIRCEKASAFLKSKGCEDVSQLQGGIHRYLETYENDGGGYWVGKNFVFDKRVTQPTSAASSKIIVGKCFECKDPFDEIDGSTVCTVCRDHVIVCGNCKIKCKNVYYCNNHLYLKGKYYYFIDKFSIEELEIQMKELKTIHEQMLMLPTSSTTITTTTTANNTNINNDDNVKINHKKKEINNNNNNTSNDDYGAPHPKRMKKNINKEKRKQGTKKFKNKRRTIMKQITKIENRIKNLKNGTCTIDINEKCRTCMKNTMECNGECWGFWSKK